jgi:hypothetical protein
MLSRPGCLTAKNFSKATAKRIGYQESEIREKFRELAGLVLIPDGVTGIEQAVNRCDQWTSVRELTDQLRRYGRS